MEELSLRAASIDFFASSELGSMGPVAASRPNGVLASSGASLAGIAFPGKDTSMHSVTATAGTALSHNLDKTPCFTSSRFRPGYADRQSIAKAEWADSFESCCERRLWSSGCTDK